MSIDWEYEDIPEVNIPPLVIQTLVENAINHGVLKRPEGGTVQIQLNDYEQHVEVIIQDDGVGMDQTQVENLLLPSTNKKRGIGLSNTNKRLMQLFGKGLEVKSKVGKGTTIRFELPK